MTDHREALQYDLITRTGYDLDDIGRALSWGALKSFIHQIDYDSALGRETRPKDAAWSTTYQTNVILADIYDAIDQINANLIAIATNKQSKQIKPYPRPYKVKGRGDSKHYGKDPLPVSELEAWFERKRKEKRDGKRAGGR